MMTIPDLQLWPDPGPIFGPCCTVIRPMHESVKERHQELTSQLYRLDGPRFGRLRIQNVEVATRVLRIGQRAPPLFGLPPRLLRDLDVAPPAGAPATKRLSAEEALEECRGEGRHVGVLAHRFRPRLPLPQKQTSLAG